MLEIGAGTAGHEAAINLLISKGADINDGDPDYDNTTQYATSRTLKILIEARASSFKIQEAIQSAARATHYDKSVLLLASGANLNGQHSTWSFENPEETSFTRRLEFHSDTNNNLSESVPILQGDVRDALEGKDETQSSG